MNTSSSAAAKGGYVRLNLDDEDEQRPSSATGGVNPYLNQQQAILEEQDQSLERIETSLRSIKSMSHQIGDELEEQSEMLDELGSAMSGVESRMSDVMKKLAKLTRLEDESRQWTAIFVLIGLIVVLLFLLVAL